MPNKKYVKGRRKEYRVCKRLRVEGFDIVQRTAGSHSPIDIIAISKYLKKIFLIQCKPEGYKLKKYDEYNWLNDEFDVEFCIE